MGFDTVLSILSGTIWTLDAIVTFGTVVSLVIVRLAPLALVLPVVIPGHHAALVVGFDKVETFPSQHVFEGITEQPLSTLCVSGSSPLVVSALELGLCLCPHGLLTPGLKSEQNGIALSVMDRKQQLHDGLLSGSRLVFGVTYYAIKSMILSLNLFMDGWNVDRHSQTPPRRKLVDLLGWDLHPK